VRSLLPPSCFFTCKRRPGEKTSLTAGLIAHESEEAHVPTNSQIVLDSIEVIWNKKELDRIPEFYTEEFVSYQGGFGLFSWNPGRDGLREIVETITKAFPDYLEEPEIVFEQGDLVIVRQDISGTNSGDSTFPATGRRMKVKDMMICRLKDGKLHEQWGLSDNYSMLIELGIIEPVVK